MGRLSTHVLDLSAGKPAQGVLLELFKLAAQSRTLVTQAKTNADGRTDVPLLAGSAYEVGTFELAFHVGDYFKLTQKTLPEPPFLDIVPIRFTLFEPDGSYHVPLLVSPWAYSTYRGS